MSLIPKSIQVVCALVQNDKGNFLLVQRSEKMPHAGQWEFPGGKVNPNENPTEALIRELQEELNLHVQILKKGNAVPHQYPNKSVELQPFFCTCSENELQLTEHSAYKWLAWSELPSQKNLLPADLDLLHANKRH
jgi:8-oxo-dGTP diphosphatase